ncbi:MAG: SET domain-containing protein [Patescibacteria group bacterium]
MFFIQDYEVRRTKHKGRSIHATADIPAGTIIGDYMGKIIRPEEEDEIGRGLYCMYYSEVATIEADKFADGIHLVNHSCTPNCGMFTFERHCLYYAMRKIFKGEEITIHYAISGPDEECSPCTHKCVCDSPMCLGTMHLPAKVYAEWEAAFTKEEGDTPQKAPVKYGEQLPLLASYPKSVNDLTHYPLFGSLQVPPAVLNVSTLPSIKETRVLIRGTGRTIKIPKLHAVIEGIMNGRHIIRYVRTTHP